MHVFEVKYKIREVTHLTSGSVLYVYTRVYKRSRCALMRVCYKYIKIHRYICLFIFIAFIYICIYIYNLTEEPCYDRNEKNL